MRCVPQQGPQLGGEGQLATWTMPEIEGLDAVGVAGQQGGALLFVVEAEGKHAAQAVKPGSAMADQPGEQHFRVAATAEGEGA